MQKIVLYKKLIVTVAEEAALSWVDWERGELFNYIIIVFMSVQLSRGNILVYNKLFFINDCIIQMSSQAFFICIQNNMYSNMGLT